MKHDTEMTFVPRNVTAVSEYVDEYGPRGKRWVKLRARRVMRRAAKLDIRKRKW
jgi:hypothetical protein